MNKYKSIMAMILSSAWLMEETAFTRILEHLEGLSLTAEDYDLFHKAQADYKAEIKADSGEFIEGLHETYVSGNVGVINIDGPMITKSTMLSSISGSTNYEAIGNSIVALNEMPDVKSLLMVMDTPGGAVTGVAELGELIANSPKPVDSYVYGTMSSAGYWLGARSRRIYASQTALVGSIGVVLGVPVPEADGSKVEIVSTQSPYKRSDVTTSEGKAEAQEMADDMADVFISTVAEGRGVTTEQVLSNFGKGKTIIASKALDAGMIDEIQPLSALLLKLNKPVAASIPATFNMKGNTMDEPVVTAPVVAAVAPPVDAVAVAMQNVQAIEGLSAMFSEHGAEAQAAVRECIDANKFTAGATKESVSSQLLAVVAEFSKTPAEAIASDAVALGEALPVSPAENITVVVKTEAEAAAEKRVIGLAAACAETKQEA